MVVLNVLKPGLDEKLYENALVIELNKAGHRISQQRQFPVHYEGQLIGKLIPDLIIGDKVIVDTKVVTRLFGFPFGSDDGQSINNRPSPWPPS